MTPAEYDQLLHDADVRLSRLRSLYEQYFQGIERVEPNVARKDLDRTLDVLRREVPRNTAARFKFQMFVARYSTYQSHWQRIVRQIEEGTYRRDLLKAKQRRRRDRTHDESASDSAPVWELDITVSDDTERGGDSDIEAILSALKSMHPPAMESPASSDEPAPSRAVGKFAAPLSTFGRMASRSLVPPRPNGITLDLDDEDARAQRATDLRPPKPAAQQPRMPRDADPTSPGRDAVRAPRAPAESRHEAPAESRRHGPGESPREAASAELPALHAPEPRFAVPPRPATMPRPGGVPLASVPRPGGVPLASVPRPGGVPLASVPRPSAVLPPRPAPPLDAPRGPSPSPLGSGEIPNGQERSGVKRTPPTRRAPQPLQLDLSEPDFDLKTS